MMRPPPGRLIRRSRDGSAAPIDRAAQPPYKLLMGPKNGSRGASPGSRARGRRSREPKVAGCVGLERTVTSTSGVHATGGRPAAAAVSEPEPAIPAGQGPATAVAAVARGGPQPGTGTWRSVRSGKASPGQRVCGLRRPETCCTSKRNLSISSSQRTRKRLMSRFVRSHEAAWLSVWSAKSERTPGGRCP